MLSEQQSFSSLPQGQALRESHEGGGEEEEGEDEQKLEEQQSSAVYDGAQGSCVF